MASNAVPPSVTPPSPYEWPQDLILYMTGVTKNNQAYVTCPGHGFTSADQQTTFICFKQVEEGCLQINGLNALIQKVIDVDTFTVNIDSTNFYAYQSGGVVIVDSGRPPVQQQGAQVFNRPFQNIATVL